MTSKLTFGCGLKAGLASAGSALALLTAAPAFAQNMAPPEAYEPADGNGVNLATGTISASTTQISIGQPGAGGLTYSASFDATAKGWRHSTWGGIDRQPEDRSEPLPGFTVTVMGQSVIFEELSAGTFGAVEGYGTLTLTNGVYTFTALDGTTATFIQNQPSEEGYEANEGVIQMITRPDGELITFTYSVVGSGPTVKRFPLSVSNNLGYQIHFEYPSGVGQKDNLTVTALNNGFDACAPTATTCTFTQTWPSLTLAAPSSTERTATDNLGRTMRLGFNVSGQLIAIARPTQTSGWSRTVSWNNNRVSTVSDGVGTWTYSIPARPSSTYNSTSTVTDPNNNTTTYAFAWEAQEVAAVRPELRSVTNGLNITTEVLQDGGGVHEITYPEGDGVRVFRNSRGDIETITRWAKPGSPALPDQIITATYSDCSTPIRCGRPTAITDARGNTTNYTYTDEGFVETETLPAPTTGADRPQTRYAYQELTAWYFDGSSPTNRAQGAGVWRPVSVSSCATGTAPSCVGTAAEVKTVTTYQSGSAAVLSNILPLTSTVGAGDNSLLATTTTVWDVNGDPYSVDGPLSGDTTRNFFDPMRQPLGAIGPDPDGGGALAFPATKTTYNADGQPTLVQTGTTAGQSNSDWTGFTSLQATASAYDSRGFKARDTATLGSGTLGIIDYSYDTGRRLLCTAVRMNPAVYGGLPSSACTLSSVGVYGDDRITRNTYDAANQLTSVQEAYGTGIVRTALTQTWTSNGKVDWIEDANGNRSDYTYSRWDKLAQLNFPSTTLGDHTASSTDFEVYAYDANGNLTSRQLRYGGGTPPTIDFTYDALNREIVKAPSTSGTAEDVFTAYDNLGRRLSARFDNATTGDGVVWTWDALGRPLTETTWGRTLTSTYDLVGRRLSLAWPSSAGGVDFAWDMAGRMTQVSETGQSPISLYLFGT